MIESHPRVSLPHVVTPADANGMAAVDDLRRWVRDESAALRKLLCTSGALLFRGFDFRAPEEFRRLAQEFAPKLRTYAGGNSPRTKVSDNLYTSTEYPKSEKI